MSALELRAPAKINLTLEVLSKRQDGYHEVRSILQTIDLCDTVRLRTSDNITLEVDGATAGTGDVESNLALRAAEALRERTQFAGGVTISLTKRIPAGAGLGGGSSDAAAVLLGLRRLWDVRISANQLAEIAASLGSDVPFFLRGGSALATGRGEALESLPEAQPLALDLLLDSEPAPDKTARMYEALERAHYGDGSATAKLAYKLHCGIDVRDGDVHNVFERVPLGEAALAKASGFGRPHLCGSGPAVFFIAEPEREPANSLTRCRTLTADEAMAVTETA